MNWTLRITLNLASAIRTDLARTHPIAAERIGFAFGSTEAAGNDHRLILLSDYAPVDDSDYLDDPAVGARISGTAIRRAMQRVLKDNRSGFHVHLHDHFGRPGFSRVDLNEIPRMVHSLRAAQPMQAHGAVLLSRNAMTAAVWLPGLETGAAPGKVVVVGHPLVQTKGISIDA